MEMEGEVKINSRPTSLLLDDNLIPEKIPLNFNINLLEVSAELENLSGHIKLIAEKCLFRWNKFPIVPPKSVCLSDNEIKHMRDMFIVPTVNDLEDAAYDENGHRKKLSQRQIKDIQEKGEFEVLSPNFSGWSHVWRVCGAGRRRSRRALQRLLAIVAEIILYDAHNIIVSKQSFSLLTGLQILLKGLCSVLDLIFGIPSNAPQEVERRLREERSRYLVAELVCKEDERNLLSAVAHWARDNGNGPVPRAPRHYTCGHGANTLQVDLSLHDSKLQRMAAPHLAKILERESRGWYLAFRDRLAAELAARDTPQHLIHEEVRAAALREYVSRVCNGVRSCQPIRALGLDIPELFAKQLQATVAMKQAVESVECEAERAARAHTESRDAKQPILRYATRRRRHQAAEFLFTQCTTRALHAHARAATTTPPPHQYFLHRDRAFLADREPVLLQELKKAVVPTRLFKWQYKIWHNKMSDDNTTRSRDLKSKHYVTDTKYFLWRWNNFLYRSWCWTLNVMFVLGVVIPLCCPLSLRALFQINPFTPQYELSQVNSNLFESKSGQTQTIWSSLTALWRQISKERTKFESKRESGLSGKRFSRQINRVTWYSVGIGGTLFYLVLLPPVILILCVLSLMAAVTSPLWVPISVIIYQLIMVLVYDFDCPNPGKRFRLVPLLESLLITLYGFCVVSCVLIAVIICPLVALVVLVGGMLWWCIRFILEHMWWATMSDIRIPIRDTKRCKRIHGPGLQQPFYYTITAEQGACIVCAACERKAAKRWAHQLTNQALLPLQNYANFVRDVFGPFSAQLHNSGTYKQLEKECNELKLSVTEKLEERLADLDLGFSDDIKKRIRMTHEDLEYVLSSCSVTALCPDDDNWSGDHTELAANMLTESLSPEVVWSIRESDARIPIQWRCERLATRWRAPDVLPSPRPPPSAPYAPPPSPRPALQTHHFDPRSTRGENHNGIRLIIPLPLPHPVIVALIVYNRDADTPVPLDSDKYKAILKCLEESGGEEEIKGDWSLCNSIESSVCEMAELASPEDDAPTPV